MKSEQSAVRELVYEAVKNERAPDEWVVETIDYASEGEVYGAVFMGHDAEQRAREYAEWKNSGGDIDMRYRPDRPVDNQPEQR